MTMVDRRSFTAALVAALACAAGPAPARTAGATSGDILVDVRPLRAQGLGAYADVIGETLRRELRAAFAGRLGDRRLVVRVDGISLRSYAGPGGGRGGRGSGMQSDYLEGEALVLGPRGEVLVRQPQLSALPSGSGGAWFQPDFEQRRLVALTQHFAGWLLRRLG